MPTIVSQIEAKEKDIKTCENRLDQIERRVRLTDLSENERHSLRSEEKQLQKKLKEHEKELSGLRKENWKSAVVSFIVMGVVAFIYYMFTS